VCGYEADEIVAQANVSERGVVVEGGGVFLDVAVGDDGAVEFGAVVHIHGGGGGVDYAVKDGAVF